MKVRLLEDAHKTWAPAGTVGELVINHVMGERFYPETTPGHPVWIGRVKWEAISEEPKADVKPTRRRR